MKLPMLRQIHTYVGLFFAPTILFFACTGAYQLFGLHEDHPERRYHPAPLVSALGQIHKDQALRSGERHGPGGPGAADHGPGGPGEPGGAETKKGPGGQASASQGPDVGAGRGRREDAPKVATIALKWFFLGGALSIVTTTGLGIWMGLRVRRTRWIAGAVLGAGAVIPLLLMLSLVS